MLPFIPSQPPQAKPGLITTIESASSGTAEKYLPPNTPPESLRKRLHELSVEVASSESRSNIRAINIYGSTVTDASRGRIWHMPFFRFLEGYYKTETELICAADSPEGDSPTLKAAKAFASWLMDIRNHPAVCSVLGERLLQTPELKELDIETLPATLTTSTPGWVAPDKRMATNQDLSDRIKQYDSRYRLNEDAVYNAADIRNALLVRDSEIPDKNWLGALGRTLEQSCSEIKFTHAPFFLGFIEYSIADVIACQTLFIDHPGSGNTIHGPVSHWLQVSFGFLTGKLNHPLLCDIVHHKQWGNTFDLEPHMNFLTNLCTFYHPDQIVCFEHDILINGRFPNTLQTLLVSGMMSEMLGDAINSPEHAAEVIQFFQLPKEPDEQDTEAIKRHWRNIRTLEYTVAGITFSLGDKAAQSLSRDHPFEFQKLEDLYTAPNHHWEDFATSSKLNNELIKSCVKTYLSPDEPYDVYLQVSTENGYRLSRVHRLDELKDQGGYVIYPSGVLPPGEVLQPAASRH